jgi:hypothetical protein
MGSGGRLKVGLVALGVVVAMAVPAGTVGALTGWAALTAPTSGLSPAPDTNPAISLVDASCPAQGWCVAVGSYNGSSGTARGIVEQLTGGQWTSTTAPLTGVNPAPGSADASFLYHVSCAAVGWCVAVGAYDTSSGDAEGLIETLANGAWSAQTAPLAGLSPTAGSGLNVGMARISCPAVGSCVAVGQYRDTSGDFDGLIEQLSDGTWTATTAPVSGLTPTPNATPETYLYGVSCWAAGSCAAVGVYYDVNSGQDAVVETLSGGVWSDSNPSLVGLNPAAYGSGDYLTAVSCATSGSCVAVGVYFDVNGESEGMIEARSGPSSSWGPTTPPVAGLTPAPAASPDLGLSSVSCPAAGSCVIVGGYVDVAGDYQALIETESAGTWSASQPSSGLSPPANTTSSAASSLGSVSCAAVGSCVGVGGYLDVNGDDQGLLATLSGGSWSAITAPLGGTNPVPGSDPGVDLGIVSCPVNGVCEAAGDYLDTSGHEQGLIESLGIGTVPPLSVVTSSMPNGAIKSTYSDTLTATGGTAPYSWSVTAGALPAGLSLNASTGVVSGTPTTAGTSNVTFSVHDSSAPVETASDAFSLTISPKVSVATTTLPAGTMGVAYSAMVSASGGTPPYTWSTSGKLPAGLTLDASTGAISGFPTKAGTTSVTFKLTDSSSPAQKATKALKIVIAKAPQAITFTSTAPASPAIGSTYVVSATASSGLTVKFALDKSSTTHACTVTTDKVKFTGAGDCIIEASQAGNTDYLAAPDVTQSVVVP